MIKATTALKSGTVRNELVSGLDGHDAVFAGAEMPVYLDGQDLFGDNYLTSHVISARDRCDYTIDRIWTVRTDHMLHRNFFPERPPLRSISRRTSPITEIKRLRREGGLTLPGRALVWDWPEEELYDIAADPQQSITWPTTWKYAEELQRHREIRKPG